MWIGAAEQFEDRTYASTSMPLSLDFTLLHIFYTLYPREINKHFLSTPPSALAPLHPHPVFLKWFHPPLGRFYGNYVLFRREGGRRRVGRRFIERKKGIFQIFIRLFLEVFSLSLFFSSFQQRGGGVVWELLLPLHKCALEYNLLFCAK